MAGKTNPTPWHYETVKTQVGVCHKIGPLGSTTKLKYACLYDDCYSFVPRDLQLLEDTKLIVRAVNAHEALVEACEWALRAIAEPIRIRGQNDQYCDAYESLKAALRLAESTAPEVRDGEDV
jgi:hypothetical protein